MEEIHAEMTGKLLTKKQVAEKLQCSTRTVENLADRGQIPKVTLGSKMVRFPEDGINRIIGINTSNTLQ
jgi:excisionase family DNA binding protein|tara:strand:+ start:578 stop:784 length:207 start_codon:yes stop_codon:yes gene_type:complete